MSQTKNFQPQVSPGNDNLTPPTTTPPTLSIESTITLTYPYVDPTTTLVLKAPEFNDKTLLQYTRIFKSTRGNSLILRRDQDWPKSETLSYSFTGILEDDKNDFLDFLEESLGLEIGLLDQQGQQWRGIIVNPNEPAIQEGYCRFSIQFSFQGVLV